MELYLSYCKTLKDKNGQDVIDGFTLQIEEMRKPKPKVPTVDERLDGLPPSAETVKKPSTRADYIDGITVGVKAFDR